MTRLFSYSKYRRLGFKVKPAYRMSENDPIGDKVVLIAVLLILAWLGLDAINGYLFGIQDQAAIRGQQSSLQKLEHLEKVMISCLQNGSMILEGVVHECRPTNMGVKL